MRREITFTLLYNFVFLMFAVIFSIVEDNKVSFPYIVLLLLISDFFILYYQRKTKERLEKSYEVLRDKERLSSLGQLIGGIAHNLKTA